MLIVLTVNNCLLRSIVLSIRHRNWPLVGQKLSLSFYKRFYHKSLCDNLLNTQL